MSESPRAAFFSAAQRRPGTVVLECERCKGRTRVSYVEFVRYHLPLWGWMPWRHHSRWMQCPSCHRRAWVAVHWFD